MIEKSIICTAFGERLRFERERLGFTQADFAGQVGINRVTQASYESGKRPPDAYYLTVVRKLGVDVGFVLFNARQGNSELLIEALERLLLQLCDGLSVPPDKADQALTSLRNSIGNKEYHAQLSDDIRLLASKLLKVSATLNASVKVLELDRDMLSDIIAGLEHHTAGKTVSPSQKALRVAGLYQMFSEKGEIDQELLAASARSLPVN